MNAKRTIAKLTVAAATLLLLPGCLERKEKITVTPDGAVRMELTYKGDAGDFNAGDALPDAGAGWQVVDETRIRDNGDEERTREAIQEFAPGAPLPDSFADPAGSEYAVALRFPTSLEVEVRDDGTYYHFKRVYTPREEARYTVLRELKKDMYKELDALTDKDPSVLTDAERSRIVEILRTVESFKRTEFVRTGAAALEDVWPQHYGLLLRQALLNHFAQIDISPVLDLMAQPDSPRRDADINAYAARVIEEARAAIELELHELQVPEDQATRFLTACDEEEARRAVTEDVGDENWKVTVVLPGTIVAHNGDKVEGDAITWEFPGKALYDREQTLMATSFVPAQSGE